MSEPFIPYGRQSIDEGDVARVVDALRSDYLTTGPTVEEFEARVAEAVGAREAVAVNSGTAALHAAYFSAGVGPGDEVVTSPLTFAATANAALYLGARVRFADVSPDTGNLDPAKVAEMLTPRTRLVVPVDFAGHPAAYDELREVTRARGVPIVADAAHSLGAEYRGRRIGDLVEAATLSFHPVKAVTTGEGGAVVTDDGEWASRARRFRSHGIEKDPARLEDPAGPWSQDMCSLGFNYRIPDINCALGISQLRRLDRFIARRREIAARYLEAFADLEGLELPIERSAVRSAWHLFVVRVDGSPEIRRVFFEKLRELRIGVQVHYVPVYWHPYYRELGYERGLCPVAEDISERSVSIPIFPAMSDDEVGSVINRVRDAVRQVL